MEDLDKTGWLVVENTNSEDSYEIRFREFQSEVPTAEYPLRLNLFWDMRKPLENGYASSEELDALHAFEDRLTDAVEHDVFAIMLMCVTGSGQREFVYHTSDPQEFINRLSQMPQEKERYPIQIQSAQDPEWAFYYNALSRVSDE